MSKLETVRALNDSGPQLQIVESVRTLQQVVSLMHEDLKRLPGAVATETAQALEPLDRLRQDVTQILEAYDEVTAIRPEVNGQMAGTVKAFLMAENADDLRCAQWIIERGSAMRGME